MSDFKSTLNINKTEFEMKANLNQKEPNFQTWWEQNDIYAKRLKLNENNERWILHDGPPYANGNIHVGHSLNKIIKDIIVRYKLLNGYYSPFIAGWDTHGLPIEHALLKKNGAKEQNLSVVERRENCKKFALENVDNQLKQFKRLGLATDFKQIYLTLNPEFEREQLNLFLAMVKKNMVFQDFKPIYWSWSSQSALAEAEIEYADVEADSIYVAFKVVHGNEFIKNDDHILIWTTTPWTIPSNLAVAVHPQYEYVRVEVKNNIYVVAKERLNSLVKALNWSEYKILNSFSGKDLEHVKYLHPLNNKINPVILANYVTLDNGTGLVHNASGFGLEDYYACKAYNIGIFCPIDEKGTFTSEVNDPDLVGVFYEKANPIIIEKLTKADALIYHSRFTHSVAIDWRTKKPVIYRATKQWFVSLSTIQDQLLKAISDVKFPNARNQEQLNGMIANRKEWCISRQRVWGVPIPIIFDSKDQPIFDEELIQNIINLLFQHGTNAWFEKPVEFFLTDKYKQRNELFYKEQDIMDVWFDSGSSYNVLKLHNLGNTSDLYFEGNDQYRGWFNSSLICSVAQNNTTPYKQLLSHGFTLDEEGRKMSKSLGNVIDPLKVCDEFGADILRLWAANSNYKEDVRISKNILTQTAEIYRRIRNTIFKFILSNISDFNYEEHKNFNFTDADNLVLNQLKENLEIIIKAYESYDFATIIKTINLHTIKLSSWYFDLIKDSLYCDEVNNQRRRVIQTTLYWILKVYLSSLTPIIPHTCEEVYKFANFTNKKESVFLEEFITALPFEVKQENKDYWNTFFKIKDAVYLKLEELKKQQVIKKTNEALVEIKFNNKLNFDSQTLKQYLNVAVVKIINENSGSIIVNATKSNLVRCERCWNYFNADEIQNELCHRCAKVVNK